MRGGRGDNTNGDDDDIDDDNDDMTLTVRFSDKIKRAAKETQCV